MFLDDFQVYRFFETSSNKQNKQDCMNFLIWNLYIHKFHKLKYAVLSGFVNEYQHFWGKLNTIYWDLQVGEKKKNIG